MIQRNNGMIRVAFCLLGLVTGCGGLSSNSGAPTAANTLADELNPNIITNPIDIADAIPSCEVNIPQLKIGGNVNAFEFTGSVGVTFGYNPGGLDSPVASGTASIQISKADMDATMVATDPMTATVEATQEATSSQTSTTINAQIDFSQFTITPQFFFQTPLATVSDKGLTSGIAGIKTQSDKLPWVGRILKHLTGSQVLLNAGSLAGVMAGDVFNVYNVTHYWSGQPCDSTYYGNTTNSKYPDAVIQVTLVSDSVSVAVLTSASESSDVQMGAQVLTGTLVAAPKGTTRYLKKYIVVGQITADNFSLPGGGTFDFQGAMNSQIIDVLNQSGAYVFTSN